MSNQEQKRGKGRPSGTFSYAAVGAAEIAKIVKNQGYIPVSKRWLKSVGVDISALADFSPLTHQHNAIVVEHKPEETKAEKQPKSNSKVIKPAEKKGSKTKKATSKKSETVEKPIQATLEA